MSSWETKERKKSNLNFKKDKIKYFLEDMKREGDGNRIKYKEELERKGLQMPCNLI